jgi:cytochrome c oxidase cbb3-type subunit 4
MDINDLRSITTVLLFLGFIGIVVWAYSSKRKEAFDSVAKSVVEDDDELAQRGGGAGQQHN